MATVHLALDGTWRLCRATKRACPRPLHLEDSTVQAANQLPKDFIEQLVNVTHPSGVDRDGVQLWFDQEGEVHRDYDLPAQIIPGVRIWHKHGKRHRANDRPAVVRGDGTKEWWLAGHRHRDGDKPAFIAADGIQEWYQRGKLYRAGGKPAIVHANGTVE